VTAEAFPQRRAADLVKLLALAPRRRAARDEVIDALWPHLDPKAGAANLHKAAHFARRALGDPQAVVLRQGVVELLPGVQVTTDLGRYEAGDESAYGGELLPDDRFEPWTTAARERVRARRLARLRAAGDWEAVLVEEPADEEAHRELMRAHAERGDLAAAARRYALLRAALERLGLQPSPETAELHARLSAGPAVRAGGPAMQPPLGRDAELAVAERLLDTAAGGRGGALLVLGDAGIGKSRFVDAVVAEAAERDWQTLRAAAHDEEGRLPYRAFAEALAPLVHERADLLARVSDGTRATLGRLVPSGPAPAEPGEPVPGHAVAAAVGNLLERTAAERPVLVALEDLYAADEGTLGLAAYLARVARSARLVLVLAARPGEASPAFARIRTRLLEHRLAAEVALGPLAVDDLRALVTAAAPRPLGAAAVGAVVAAAAGNPFFAEELASAVDDTGAVTIPAHLGELLDARLDRLPEPAAVLLPVLAILDDGFSAADVAAVARADVAAVEDALEAGRRHGVLARAGGGLYRFRHPLLRDAARRRTPADRLAAAHADAAERLAAAGAEPARIATHLLACGRPAEAVPLLRDAARAAAGVGAVADGTRLAERALEHAGPDLRAELLELLGDLRHAGGDRRSVATYAAARRAGRPADALRIKEARAHVAFGDLDAAEAAIADVDPQGPHASRGLLVGGMVAWYRGDVTEAARRADRAAEFIETRGEEPDDLLFDLRAMLAHAEGRWDDVMSWQLAESWRIPALADQIVDAYLCVTEYVLHAGDPHERLVAFARRLHDQARESGARRGEGFAATVLGEALLLAGDVPGALDRLREAARLSREVGSRGGEALARARLGDALRLAGDRRGARAQLEEAVELAHASPLAHHVLHLAYAPLVRLPERPAEAVEVVDRAEELLDAEPECRFCPIDYWVTAASTCARAGDGERGREFLGRAERSAQLWAGGPWSAAIAEARGHLLRCEGDEERAAAEFLRAAEGFAAAGQRLNAERARSAL